MKTTFFILAVCVTFSTTAQNFRPDVQMLLDSISSRDYIPVQPFFLDSMPAQLSNLISNKELEALTYHENPLVRVQALLAILTKKDVEDIDFTQLFARHLFDTSEVKFKITADYIYFKKMPVGSVYAQMIANYFGEITMYISSKKYKPKEAEKRFMDSMIICQQVPLLEEKEMVSLSLKPYPAYYEEVKRQVVNNNDKYALFYLSKFQKEEDIDLILEKLPQTGTWEPWVIFRFFKHPRLFDYLKMNLAKDWKNRIVLKEIAAYQSLEAAILLEEVYKKAIQHKNVSSLKHNIEHAVNRYYTGLYADLYIQMLNEDIFISWLDLPDSLWAEHGDKLFQVYVKWNTGNTRFGRRNANKLYLKAKEYIEKTDIAKMPDLILGQIQFGKQFKGSLMAFKYIFETHDTVFIEPLFEMLEKVALSERRFFVAKILMSYEKPEIDKRLMAFFEKYPNLIPGMYAAKIGGGMYRSLVNYKKQY